MSGFDSGSGVLVVNSAGGGVAAVMRLSRLVVVLLVGVLLASLLGVVDSGRVAAQEPPPAAVLAPVVNDDGTVTVPFFWGLKPTGLVAGDKFRLLFVTSTTRDATEINLSMYDSFVQARAAAGHSDIRGHSSRYKVVASSLSNNARTWARMRTAELLRDTPLIRDVVAPVYWLNGPRISQDYGSTAGVGFWSSSWENGAAGDVRDELGRGQGVQGFTPYSNVWTGSQADGTRPSRELALGSLFGNTARVGSFSGGSHIDNGNNLNVNGALPFYGISPVYVVAEEPPLPVVSVSRSGSGPVAEGGSETFTVSASSAPGQDITVRLGLLQDQDYGARLSSSSVVLTSSSPSAMVTVSTVDDSIDEDGVFWGYNDASKYGSFTVVLLEGDGYLLAHSDANPSAVRVQVTDNDSFDLSAHAANCDRAAVDNGGDRRGVDECLWPPPEAPNVSRYVDVMLSESDLVLDEGESRVLALTFSRRESWMDSANSRVLWNPDAGVDSFVSVEVIGDGTVNTHNQVLVRVSALETDDVLPGSVLDATRPKDWEVSDWRVSEFWEPHVLDVTVGGVLSVRQPRVEVHDYEVPGCVERQTQRGQSTEKCFYRVPDHQRELTTPDLRFGVTVVNNDMVVEGELNAYWLARNLLNDARKWYWSSGSDKNWLRVLDTLNEIVPVDSAGRKYLRRWGFSSYLLNRWNGGSGLRPLTLGEARLLAAGGSQRWQRVVDVLVALGFTDPQAQQGELQPVVDSNGVYQVPDSLVAAVKGYAAETGNGVAHVNRWKRVLIAFGETVPGFTGSAMTVAEAQGFANQFWSVRWDPIVAALKALAANPPLQAKAQQDQQQQLVSDTSDTETDYQVPASLVADVQGYAAEGQHGVAHVTRWKRVLLAFGETVPGFTNNAMTATEAQSYADKGWSRWDPVVAALTNLEQQTQQKSQQQDPTPVDPVPVDPTPVDPVPVDPVPTPVVVPEISITAGNTVTEGGSAVFTLTASPVPSAALQVNANVTSSGDYGVTTGSQTVTIPTTGTATLAISTTGDSIDEPDGSVTVTVATGNGYSLNSSASAATVSITDDDNPPPPPPPPPAADAVTISVEDSTYVEGRSPFYLVRFRLNKPASERVTVTYTPQALGTGPGYATAGQDFVSRTSVISFRPGVTSNIGLVYALSDRVKEPDETFTIVLSEPTGGVHISDKQPVLTIKDND